MIRIARTDLDVRIEIAPCGEFVAVLFGSGIALKCCWGRFESTVTDDPDDTDKTRVDTPIAMARLGLEDCPMCERTGVVGEGDVCPFCDGGRVVSKERAEEWRARRNPAQ